ncbi:hypothetical protein ACWOEQ_07590 [Enterococcus asini]|nr:hypothetical protein RU94_GL001723 [Enterococcus asini]
MKWGFSMPFLALLLDLLAALVYYFQLDSLTDTRVLLGLVLQIVIFILLALITFTYKGKRYAAMQPYLFMKYFSIRYSIIVLSFILNGFLLFLYVLNFMGINDVIFSAY